MSSIADPSSQYRGFGLLAKLVKKNGRFAGHQNQKKLGHMHATNMYVELVRNSSS